MNNLYSKKSNGWLKHLDRTYYQVGALVILVTGVVFATLSDNYRNILKRSWLKELKASIIYVSALVIVLALYLLLSQTTFWYSRTVFVLLAILCSGCVFWPISMEEDCFGISKEKRLFQEENDFGFFKRRFCWR